MNNVIIVGGDHHNTLGVIRAFGRCGISPYVIMTSPTKDSFVLKSRYIKQSWIVESRNVVEFLLENLVFDEKAVLVACHDVISGIFDQHYNTLSKHFYVPGSKIEGSISQLAEKEAMSKLATELGMNVPTYSLVDSSDYLSALSHIEYPCITKPAASRDGGKCDIVICNNEYELTSFLCARPNRQFIVQKFIVKDYEFQLIGCSLDDGNTIIIPGVSELIRPSKSSNTGFLKYTTLDESYKETLEKCKEFVKATRYNGLFSVEYLRDKDGVDYFMEINFRNDGNTICVTNSGVNLPMIWFNHSVGNQLGNTSDIHTEYVMPEFQELQLWYSGEISLWSMIKDFRQATSYMDYDKDDEAPTNDWVKFRKQLFHDLYAKPIKKILRKT